MEPDRTYRLLMEEQNWTSLCARAIRFAATFLMVFDDHAVYYGRTAEDLGMEAIERVASGKARWDPGRDTKIETYLYRVTRNLVLSHIRDNMKREPVEVSPQGSETHEQALGRLWSDDADPFPNNGPRPQKAWAEQVVNGLLEKVGGMPVIEPMVEHMYETGETKRSAIAAHIGVTPMDITNASKRLRRITQEVVDQHADLDGAVQYQTAQSQRGAK